MSHLFDMPTSAKKKDPLGITVEDIRIGIDRERDTTKICSSLLRKDVIHKLRDFLSDRPAIAYGPKHREGQPILKKDGTQYKMSDLEHALHLQWDETKELLTPDGSDLMRTEFGDTVPDGEIVELTSGAEGVVAPTVWGNKDHTLISIHTHPKIPLDEALKEKLLELKEQGYDTMNIYNEVDNTLADPHMLSRGDILAYLSHKVKAGCLAERRLNRSGEDVMVLKCYNLRCLYPSEQKRFFDMTATLSKYEDSMRAVRASDFWGKSPTEAELERKLRAIQGLMKTSAFYDTNPQFSKFYYDSDCQCQFRFDPS